jgi:peptidoglycan/LPS O-acetylase OafA/YrhL
MPFLQALIWLFPGIWVADLWWTLFFAAAPVSLLAAMLSWHFVEKPTLRLRKKFSFTAARSEVEATKPAREAAAPDLPVSAIRVGTGAT